MEKKEIERLAKKELEEEKLRVLIEKEKDKLRNKKNRFFPWRIKIIRID